MASGIPATPTAARKNARDRALKVLDAEDEQRRRREQERRKRVSGHAGDITGNQAEIEQLTARIAELRADCARHLAAIVADGVSEAQAAEMTGRELREVKAAVKAEARQKAPVPKKRSAAKSAASAAPAAA
ncbi:MAG: hypothetical protein ACJ786_28155 [Catenulispora sp.]